MKDNLHKIAKRYNREEDWRNFRAQRNLVNKINKANKSKYYNFRLDIDPKDNGGEEKYNNEVRSKVMCGTFKNLTNSSKQIPPRVILYNGNLITSIKKL